MDWYIFINIYAANSDFSTASKVLLQLFLSLTFFPGSPDTLASKISQIAISADVLDSKKKQKKKKERKIFTPQTIVVLCKTEHIGTESLYMRSAVKKALPRFCQILPQSSLSNCHWEQSFLFSYTTQLVGGRTWVSFAWILKLTSFPKVLCFNFQL